MGASSVIRIIVTGNSEGAKRALEGARKDAEHTGSSLKTFGKIGAASFAVVAAAAVEFGREAVKAADKEELSHKKLLVALKNSGQAWKDNAATVEKADKAGEQYGYTAADTEDALARAEMSTKSTAKSVKLLALAQNLAAFKGMDLNAALLAVTKASQGQLRPLKQIGVDLPIATGGALKTKKAYEGLLAAQQNLKDVQEKLHTSNEKAADLASGKTLKAQKSLEMVEAGLHGKKNITLADQLRLKNAQDAVSESMQKGTVDSTALETAQKKLQAAQQNLTDSSSAGNNILRELQTRLKGQASAAADTFSGKMKALHARFEDWQASIGKKLIPIIIKLMDWIQKSLIPAVQNFIAIVQQDWPKVRDAIVPVMQHIMDYINGFVTTVEHLWSQFGGRILSIAKEYFNHIRSAVMGALEVIKGLFRLFGDILTGKWGKIWGDLVAIFKGLWKILSAAIGLAFDELKSIVSLAWDAIKNLSAKAIGKIWEGIKALPGKIAGAFTAMGKGIVNGLIWGLNKAIDLINKFQIHIKAHKIAGVTVLPSWDWNGLQIPHIPTLHTGGIFDSGQGEGYAKLKDGEGVFTPAQMAAMGGGRGGRGDGGGPTVIQNFHAQPTPSMVKSSQTRWAKRNGRPAPNNAFTSVPAS